MVFIVTSQRTDRSNLLDSIRALAIFLVFAFHVASRYPSEQLDFLADTFKRVGFLGVDIFFPLSGFLITKYLLTANSVEFIKIFFLRRFFRIIPIYFVAILCYFFASMIFGIGDDVIHRIWINCLFLTGWYVFFEGKDTVPFLITWSLSVEEFSYILLGLAAWLKRSLLLPFLVFLVAASIFIRWNIMSNSIDAEAFRSLYYLPIARMDSIALGGITAFFTLRNPKSFLFLLVVVGMACAVLMYQDLFMFRLLLFFAVAVATCCAIVVAVLLGNTVDIAPVRWMASLGFYSYFNYLFQFFVIDILLIVSRDLFSVNVNYWIVLAVSLAVTQCLAIISFKYFEGPLMKFGRNLESRGLR